MDTTTKSIQLERQTAEDQHYLKKLLRVTKQSLLKSIPASVLLVLFFSMLFLLDSVWMSVIGVVLISACCWTPIASFKSYRDLKKDYVSQKKETRKVVIKHKEIFHQYHRDGGSYALYRIVFEDGNSETTNKETYEVLEEGHPILISYFPNSAYVRIQGNLNEK